MRVVNLGVHDIVDFLLKSGDIDSRYFNGETMREGSEMHRSFQKEQDASYASEVALSMDYFCDVFEYHITGRADGIKFEDGEYTVDEIKSTNGDLEKFFMTNEKRHLGQAQFYALMLARERELRKVKVTLTYLKQEARDKMVKRYIFTREDLEETIKSYLESYSTFLTIIARRKRMFLSSLRTLRFPFSEMRKGQDVLIEKSYETSRDGLEEFVEASTGIGKTISTIYGALDSFRDEKIDRLFYLSAKNTGFLNATNAMKIFTKGGLSSITTEITAKEKICLNEGKIARCNPLDCPYARNYYSKIAEVLKSSLYGDTLFDKEKILSIAKENFICPFELSLDLASYSDIIVCDYNYVFNPTSYLKRYFDETDDSHDIYLLIDEAHNLIDRGRDMYSASLSKRSLLAAFKKLKKAKVKKLEKSIVKLKSDLELFNSFEMEGNFEELQSFDEEFLDNLSSFNESLKSYAEEPNYISDELVDDASRGIYKFLLIYSLFKDDPSRYSLYVEKGEDIFLNIRCLDASCYIKERCLPLHGVLFFSATLSPSEYYEKLVMGSSIYPFKEIPSPFSQDNFRVLIDATTSIFYKDRDKTMDKVAKECETFVKGKMGNYIIYCPSFEYLKKLAEIFEEDEFDCIYQAPNMNTKEREGFLSSFKENPSNTIVGVAVLGGSFAEGIDLVGNRLIGIVVIGVGLPMISFENGLIKRYYDEANMDGFSYAYSYVGYNKVMQAVGRLIRTESDRGMALLIDARYKGRLYKKLFSETRPNSRFISSESDIASEIEEFYRG
jgi:Rad3-related DNA helicase